MEDKKFTVSSDSRFAILIDAENTSSKYIKIILDEITKDYVITYKRIYGDWTSPQMQSWKDLLLEHSITPIQQYSYVSGKNASDSAMIIDAMDMLYSSKVEGFCLVSSDSDFTRLATRLREDGMTVIGMGRQQTPRPFVSACNQFKFLDLIAQTDEKQNQQIEEVSKSEPIDSSQTPIDTIKEAIRKIIEDNSEDDGWVLASQIGTLLLKQYSDFDCRNYRYRKMIDLLEGLGFKTEKRKDPNNIKNPNGLVISVKNSKN